MRVRLTSNKDLDGITALFGRCYPILMSAAYSEEVLARALPAMTTANPQLVSSDRFYAVENDGIIVGCGGWSFETPGTGAIIDGIAHLRHFAVDPSHNRKGIGQAIYRQCTSAARKAGATKFQAFSSLNAEPFYSSMGLKRLDQFNVLMGNKIEFPVIFMEGTIEC